MNSFSPQLIDRLIRYMQEQHGVTLTPEEADKSLAVYSEAFLAFKGVSGAVPRPELHDSSLRVGTRAGKSHEVATPTRPDDLITPHNC